MAFRKNLGQLPRSLIGPHLYAHLVMKNKFARIHTVTSGLLFYHHWYVRFAVLDIEMVKIAGCIRQRCKRYPLSTPFLVSVHELILKRPICETSVEHFGSKHKSLRGTYRGSMNVFYEQRRRLKTNLKKGGCVSCKSLHASQEVRFREFNNSRHGIYGNPI